ncbi:hypothetical protein GCM10028810_28370 [Spirosoma litoris]
MINRITLFKEIEQIRPLIRSLQEFCMEVSEIWSQAWREHVPLLWHVVRIPEPGFAVFGFVFVGGFVKE